MLSFFLVFSFLHRIPDAKASQIKINQVITLSIFFENTAQLTPSSFDEAFEGFSSKIFITAIIRFPHLICSLSF